LVSLLAALADSQLDKYAADWANTEELSGSSASDLRPIIIDLRRLAIACESPGRNMYLWGSL
jgi:hypothetical protein